MKWWEELEVWKKRVTVITALVGALLLTIQWGRAAAEAVHWQSEADALEKAIEQHHEDDIKLVLEEIATQKKLDRIQRNHRELARLQRDLTGGNYTNDGEKDFILKEIDRLERSIACDDRGDCR